jgi:hypothetical protein
VPTVLIVDGFRFFFYSNENNEPPHIHIDKAEASGKVWLVPAIDIVYMYGFSNSEQKEILKIINLNSETFIKKWHEYFSK